MSTIFLSENESLETALCRAKQNDTLVLKDRTYREKIAIRIDGLTLVGEKNTKIVYDDYAKKIHADGLEYVTFRTSTLTILADQVTLRNITIENDAYNPQEKGQAVALTVLGNYFRAEYVTLKSAQDTLFLGPLPDDLVVRYDGFLPDDERLIEGTLYSTFYECSIYGSVDYVFGCGESFFNKCKFININDGRNIGYVSAPAHSLKQKEGFVFDECDFIAEDGLNAEIYLARPWRDFGKSTFIDCNFASHISKEGFDKWNDTSRDKTARFEVSNCTKIENLVKWAKVIDRDKLSITYSGQFPLIRK